MPSFFLVTRRPRISTLFPSTTLFRSGPAQQYVDAAHQVVDHPADEALPDEVQLRSEEHTSELQSRFGISYAVFFFSDTATTYFYSLPLHDALPIWAGPAVRRRRASVREPSSR